MRIEEGKCYETRNGRKATPVDGLAGWFDLDSGGWRLPYAANGEVCAMRSGNHKFDLIAEWTDAPTLTDGPVRTVTRREVVPGVWSGVVVQPHEEGVVLVGFEHPYDQQYVSMSSDALRAAAAVLLELAGALDD